MANEVTINVTVEYEDAAGVSRTFEAADKQSSPSTTKSSQMEQTINTSETVLNLGDCSATPGWFIAKNLDATNYVDIKCAASGTILGRMYPGMPCGPIYLGTGAQVPVAIAHTGACKIELLVVSA